MPQPDETEGMTRRELLKSMSLAGASAGGLGISGCLSTIDSLTGDSGEQISLSIKMPPADEDEEAVRIAKHIRRNLQKAGINITLVPESYSLISFFEDVLLEGDFDIYVGEHPGGKEADYIRTFLHSEFVEESGWQNPTGYSNLGVDRLLERQKLESKPKRKETLEEVQKTVVQDNPVSVIGFVDERRAVSEERYTGWLEEKAHTFFSYMGIEKKDGNDGTDEDVLRVVISDSRPTSNLNPLTSYRRLKESIIELLYDSLGKEKENKVHPWMAESWVWEEETSEKQGESLRIDLRKRLTWHDREPITSRDVKFTYELLKDTTKNEDEVIPAPVYREFSSLIDSVETIDRKSVRINFVPCTRKIAELTLTVPVLPRHIWKEKAVNDDIGGVDIGASRSKAVSWDNINPVGSGPLKFESVNKNSKLVLTRYDGHFLRRQNLEGFVAKYEDKPVFDRLVFNVVPSDAIAVEEFVKNGRADFTGTNINVRDVPRVAKAENLRLVIDSTSSFYHVGFNTQEKPLANPRFRRAVSQLIDKKYIVENIFRDYIKPATSLLDRTEFLAPELRWGGEDAVLPFVGENGTGEVEKEKAQEVFREAGYHYNDDDKLVVR